MSKYVLKKDIVFKAGTVFENIDGRKSHYIDGNYSHTIGLTDNSSGEFIYGIEDGDCEEWFERIES